MKARWRTDKIKSILDKEKLNDYGLNGYSLSIQEDCKGIIEEDYKRNYKNYAISLGQKDIVTLDSVINSSFERTRANFGDINSGYIDPRSFSFSSCLFISPMEVQMLYANGIPKKILDGKAKNFLISGMSITNSKYTDAENDKIEENKKKKCFDTELANALASGLGYGGQLFFPIFYKDNHLTTELNLKTLLKLGILKKDCINYFVSLDRWNVFVIPPTNPTQKDFIMPDYFTIPFLGGKVKSTRCARLVTSPQLGYWGKMLNLGWGISDFVHYAESYFDYEMCIQALNGMIKNMSIVYRKLPFTEVMAMDGLNGVRKSIDELKEQLENRTIEDKISQIVNFDTIGDLGCINRDFGDVDKILKLRRQDLCAKAGTFEPLIFTIDKGAFASGDDTQGVLMKQYESNEMLYKELSDQLKNIAMIMVIDALGTDDHIIKNLEYTEVRFNKPIAVNALEKAQIGKLISESILNYGSVGYPEDITLDIVDETVDNKGMFSKTLREKLKNLGEEKTKLRFEKEKAEIDAIKAQIKNSNVQVKDENGEKNKVEETQEYKKSKVVGGHGGTQSATRFEHRGEIRERKAQNV